VRRALILVSAVVIQLCLGATYSWSIFVSPLRDLTGLSQARAQLPFSVFYFAFPTTVAIAGTLLLPRLGPRRSACLGGALFGCGWMIGSLGRIHFALTILGNGLVAGVGAGVAYLVPIAVAIQWFPRHKGLVTGIAVAGFGGGAALVGNIGGYLLGPALWPVFDVFAVFGSAFLMLTVLAGSNLRDAPGRERRGPPRISAIETAGRRDFRILYVAMLSGLAAGFAVNANLRELHTRAGIEIGVAAVSLFAVANAGGRIVYGWIIDRIGPSRTIRLNLLLQAAVLVSALRLVSHEAGFLIVASLVGLNYGGVNVVHAASVSRIWGADRFAPVYGLLFSANIAAALSPVLAGSCYDRFENFDLALGGLAFLLVVAALLVRRNRSVLDLPGPASRDAAAR
jgi:OFA family oxalate/formate antiporter-like MFS transporter